MTDAARNRPAPFRVLSLDGGGMRGAYTASYLHALTTGSARQRGVPALDFGKTFDLIVGTSTGGIIACSLALGVPLARVVDLYKEHGRNIFPLPLGHNIGKLLFDDFWRRRAALHTGAAALRRALEAEMGSTTLGELHAKRGIALAITAVSLSHHRSWVFKTRHLPTSNGRDDGYRLVDVCMATSAAPIYRSLTAIDDPDGSGSHQVFADGGLWANNPVLVGLIDALAMAGRDREIEVYCLGACPRPAGELVARDQVDRTIRDWRGGGDAAALAIDAQEFAYDNMARMLLPHLDRPCSVVRFPRESVPAKFMQYLDLDDTRPEAVAALVQQARHDADMTNSRCGNPQDADGQRIKHLLTSAPVAQAG
jgi:uncharacterized protein